jgi:hypothetical protein
VVTAPEAKAPTKLDATYEAYRNAMLSSGPRGQIEESKIQSKSSGAAWKDFDAVNA